VSDIEGNNIEFDKVKTPTVITMHDLFYANSEGATQVTDDECSVVTKKKSNVSDNITSKIEDLVNLWRDEVSGKEYTISAKRMSYLHRLTQMRDEIGRAIEEYKGYDFFNEMQEEVELLRLDIIGTTDECAFIKMALRTEEINRQFGVILTQIGIQHATGSDGNTNEEIMNKEDEVKQEEISDDIIHTEAAPVDLNETTNMKPELVEYYIPSDTVDPTENVVETSHAAPIDESDLTNDRMDPDDIDNAEESVEKDI